MKRVGFLLAATFCIALMSTATKAQVPILYYDFEDNAARGTFQNAFEQRINGFTSAVSRAGATTTITGTTGAGNSPLYGAPAGSTAGSAASSSNWPTSGTDPLNAATNYYQFTVSTAGFTGISVRLDSFPNATNGPNRVNVIYSVDGGTTFIPLTAITVANSNRNSWTQLTFPLGASADNTGPITMRVYAFNAAAAAGTWTIDNLQVMAASTTTAAGEKILLNEPNIFTSTTSGATGIFLRSGFTATGGGTSAIITSQLALTGTGFTISNDAAFRIDAGGFVSGQGPTYNVPSFLSYNTGGTFARSVEWSATSGPGFPNKVAINGGTTLNMGANGGTNTARQISGFLTVNNGTFQMAGANPMTQPVTAPGGVNLTTGAIILSTLPGGDLFNGGSWNRGSSSTFTPNGRTVTFNGTGLDTITVSGIGNIETFDYLVVDKPSGELALSIGNQTNLIVAGPNGGSALQLINAGGINLNGNGLTMNGAVAGTNILVGGAAAPATRTITGTGTFAITGGPKSVTNNNGKTLTFDTGVKVSLFQGMNFGPSLTTINGTLTIGSGGSVNTNPPTYGPASTLLYDCTCVFNRGAEWTNALSGPGAPNNVTVNTNTDVNLGGASPSTALQALGTLDAKTGGRFRMEFPGSEMTAALSVFQNVLIEGGGSLLLSTVSGGDLKVRGDFTNNGTFTPNNRLVFFEGGATETVNAASGTLAMPYVRINKSGGTVQLGNTDLQTLGPAGGNSLEFTGATSTLTLNGRTLTLGSTVGTPPAGSGLVGDVNANLSLQNGGATGPMGTLVFVVGGQSLSNLTINRTGGAGSATLGSDLTVNTVLNLTAGDIITGSNVITMPPAATSTGVGDVVGNVRRTGFVNGPPNTNSKTFGNPNVQISFQTGTPATEVTVNLAKSRPTGAGFGFPTAINRTYTVEQTGATAFTATFRMHYVNADLTGNPAPPPAEEVALDLWRFNGTTWNRVNKTASDIVTADNKWVESSLVTQFSPWTLSAMPLAPTAARLREFRAKSFAGGGVSLEWQTAFETDNLGFNVYREDGNRRTLVTPGLIAGSALTVGPQTALNAGNSYTWFDRGGTAASRYYLEDVDTSGNAKVQGPFWPTGAGRGVRPKKSTAVALSSLGAGESEQNAQHQWTPPAEALTGDEESQKAAADAGQLLASNRAVKLLVRRGGWYRVTRAQLEAAGLSPNVDPARLQLFAGGVRYAVSVDANAWANGGAIEFYGEGLNKTSTDTRVYWLVEGATADRSAPREREIVAASPNATNLRGRPRTPGATSFTYTTELKERTIYFSSLLNGETENFFGGVVSATPGTKTLAVRNLQTGNGAASLEVALQGVTAGAHDVSVLLNGAEIGAISFNGRENKAETFSLKAGQLREGANDVRLVSSGSGDISLTDYIRITYQHLYRADDDALRFGMETGRQARVAGFASPNIRVVDVTDPANAVELTKLNIVEGDASEGGGYAVTLQPFGESQRTLLAFTDARVSHVAGVVSNKPSDWHASREADFVIITTSAFLDAVEPLAAKREAEGLKTTIVDVEDLYDEFSNGEHTPQAVKDFLAWTSANWQRAPRYVLLVGDGSYDPRDYGGTGSSDFVPAKLLDTVQMETASDSWLADFDGDGLSDIAIGRLPVRTAGEAGVVISKIVGSEPDNSAPAAVLVADRNGPDGYSFEAATDTVQALVPAGVGVSRINRGAQSADAVRGQIVSAVNAGPQIVNWMGHGSVNVWTGDGLLRSEDAAGLQNGGRLSLYVMMTCLNGYFHSPGLDSLSESLLKAEAGGALAAWTSTGMTEPEGQAAINRELYRALYEGQGALRLGDAMRRAGAATTDPDVRRTWVLIGDPTSRWR